MTQEFKDEQLERLKNAKKVFNTMIDNCIELHDGIDYDNPKTIVAYQEEVTKRFINEFKSEYTQSEMQNIGSNIVGMGRAIMANTDEF